MEMLTYQCNGAVLADLVEQMIIQALQLRYDVAKEKVNAFLFNFGRSCHYCNYPGGKDGLATGGIH